MLLWLPIWIEATRSQYIIKERRVFHKINKQKPDVAAIPLPALEKLRVPVSLRGLSKTSLPATRF